MTVSVPASSNLLRLSRQLFEMDEEERTAFLEAVQHPRPYQPAVMWLQECPPVLPFATVEVPDWLPGWVDLCAPGERPGPHPLHEAGAYYVLDVSSAFCASVLTGIPSNPGVVLDVRAAPGGRASSRGAVWSRFFW
jgi:16S rRNA C967 or C1407 C5-methylase (RsmB/RsmF family)